MRAAEKMAARIAGASTYFTGRPCSRGHVSERRRSGVCVECDLESKAKYRARSKEKIRAYDAQKYAALSDAERAKLRARNRKRYHKVRDTSAYRASALYRVRKRQENVKRATPPWVDQDGIKQIYIGRPPGFHVDHIVPLRGKNVCGLHVPWNLQYLPAAENCRKSRKFEDIIAVVE